MKKLYFFNINFQDQFKVVVAENSDEALATIRQSFPADLAFNLKSLGEIKVEEIEKIANKSENEIINSLIKREGLA